MIKIDNLIDSLSHKKELAVIDSSGVKNNRRNWIIVYNCGELKTVCELYVSEIEKDNNDEFALIYAVLNFGPLAEKGIIYVFKKEEHTWKMILKRIPWVS